MTHSLKIDCHGPAAFRRLCVETNQPAHTGVSNGGQPPSGGCVLKHFHPVHRLRGFGQPPSGGCVLKLNLRTPLMPAFTAAFRRLCVETVMYSSGSPLLLQPPSGGCVLKQQPHPRCYLPKRSAAFRRLCVET